MFTRMRYRSQIKAANYSYGVCTLILVYTCELLILWTKWSRETLRTKLVSPLILAYMCYKGLPRNHGWYTRECEIDDATLLINARNWHFQPPEIENVLGWGSFWNKPTLSHCCPTSRQRKGVWEWKAVYGGRKFCSLLRVIFPRKKPQSYSFFHPRVRSIINSVPPRPRNFT